MSTQREHDHHGANAKEWEEEELMHLLHTRWTTGHTERWPCTYTTTTTTSAFYIKRCKRRHGHHIFLCTNHRSDRIECKNTNTRTHCGIYWARILKQRIVSGLINLRPSFTFFPSSFRRPSFLLLLFLCALIRSFLVLSLILFFACMSAIFKHFMKCGALHTHTCLDLFTYIRRFSSF